VSKDDPFDLKNLTATEDLIANQRKTAASVTLPRERLVGQFILVPFEMVPAFSPQSRVLLRLLYLIRWRRRNTVVLANKELAKWGVSRKQKLKALRKLEQAGHIVVEWRKRKSPRVTLTAKV
jgi:hypothetical protein